MVRHATIGLAAALLAVCPSCGGGGGGGGGGPDTVTLVGVPALDGYLIAGAVIEASHLIVGNFATVGLPAKEMRAIATFDLSPLPRDAQITSAVVTLFQEPLVTLDPYTARGPILLDHVSLGGLLDVLAFGADLLASDIGVLSSDATPGAKSLEVGDAVQADLDAGRRACSFRLRFQTVVAVAGAHIATAFGDAEGSDGSLPPTLVVTFTR